MLGLLYFSPLGIIWECTLFEALMIMSTLGYVYSEYMSRSNGSIPASSSWILTSSSPAGTSSSNTRGLQFKPGRTISCDVLMLLGEEVGGEECLDAARSWAARSTGGDFKIQTQRGNSWVMKKVDGVELSFYRCLDAIEISRNVLYL